MAYRDSQTNACFIFQSMCGEMYLFLYEMYIFTVYIQQKYQTGNINGQTKNNF